MARNLPRVRFNAPQYRVVIRRDDEDARLHRVAVFS
jgi:hypothetical protein